VKSRFPQVVSSNGKFKFWSDGGCTPASTPDDYFERAWRDWNRKQGALRESAKLARAANIARICARHELESDEFFTAEQKAEKYL
jgi:hypothetical protein